MSSFFLPTLNVPTASDLDVLIPYRKMTDLLYVIAKTGDLCAPVAWNGTDSQYQASGLLPNHPARREFVKATLPVRVDVLSPNVAWGFISARMEITFQLTPNCSAITMTATAVNIENLTGAVNYVKPNGVVVSMNVTTFVNSSEALPRQRYSRSCSRRKLSLPGHSAWMTWATISVTAQSPGVQAR